MSHPQHGGRSTRYSHGTMSRQIRLSDRCRTERCTTPPRLPHGCITSRAHLCKRMTPLHFQICHNESTFPRDTTSLCSTCVRQRTSMLRWRGCGREQLILATDELVHRSFTEVFSERLVMQSSRDSAQRRRQTFLSHPCEPRWRRHSSRNYHPPMKLVTKCDQLFTNVVGRQRPSAKDRWTNAAHSKSTIYCIS